MGVLEIVLLIAGVAVFTLSFLIPVKKEQLSEQSKKLAEDEIKRLVSQEMDSVKGRVDDTVDEAMDQALEKTERSLEKLSNEKIMAVSDYSDTVIKDIHKNHEEVVFLYDMLNDKQTSLKNTVAQVNETVKAVEETTRGAEEAMGNLKQIQEEAVKQVQEAAKEPVDTGIMRIAKLQGKVVTPPPEERPPVLEELTIPTPVIRAFPEEPDEVLYTLPQAEPAIPVQPVQSYAASPGMTAQPYAAPTPSGMAAAPYAVVQPLVLEPAEPMFSEQDDAESESSESMSNNDRILALYKQGKSEIAIAKELELGVGEVSLVIQLYKD